jgi:DNA-binding Lrp family transcriptional regulator
LPAKFKAHLLKLKISKTTETFKYYFGIYRHMNLTRPMVRVFWIVCHENGTLQGIAKEAGKSLSWSSEILTQLIKAQFVTAEFAASRPGSRKIFKVAGTAYAIKLKQLMYAKPYIDFSEIITGSKLRVLMAILYDWKDYETISKMMNTSAHAVRQTVPKLKNRGIITKKGRLLKFNNVAWSHLFEFLKELRNFSGLNGFLLWQYGKETIYIVDNIKLAKGTLTGFNRYRDFGVRVVTVTGCCYLPEKKLSKEEIFVHSLLQVDDPRLLHLALAFYLKHKLDTNRVKKLAMHYDCHSRYEELKTLPLLREGYKKLEYFRTEFDRKDFRRIAHMYRVKNV